MESGTSFSAPQVAGLAALLMDRHSSLRTWPEAVKSIIMASAVHNIEGRGDIPTGQELKDGAGSIDAALADESATFRQTSSSSPCDSPCWWGNITTSTSPPVGGSLYRYFNALRGERIRVAISWFSNADSPLNPPNLARDELDTNYNLYVYSPSAQRVGYTASSDNNYELAEFTAPETGQYKIRVYRSSMGDNNESSNSLGIAWTKQATYLPDVKGNYNGWTSEITIRNDGATTRDTTTNNAIRVTFLQPDGSCINPQPDGSCLDKKVCTDLAPNEVCRFLATEVGNFWGHAIVNASESVSVIVTNKNGDEMTAYNGILPEGSSGDPGWEQTGSTLYAPMVKRSHYGRSSDVYVVNVGAAGTNINATYYITTGVAIETDSFYLAPGQANLLAPASPGNTTSTLYSAVITHQAGYSPQPLAALVMEHSDSGPKRSTHNVFRAGQAEIYAPLVKKDWGTPTQRTGLSIQNVGDNSTNIYVKYYNSVDGSLVKTLGPGYPDTPSCMYNLPPKATCVIYNPSSLGATFLGSARVYSSNAPPIEDQPIVGMVHENALNINRFMSHLMALADNSKTIFFPRQGKNWLEDGKQWTAAAMIMNVGNASTQVTVDLYNENGTWAGDIGPIQLGPYQGFSTRSDSDMDGLNGSAVATSSGEPIVAEVNYVNNGPNGNDPPPGADTGSSFNGANR